MSSENEVSAKFRKFLESLEHALDPVAAAVAKGASKQQGSSSSAAVESSLGDHSPEMIRYGMGLALPPPAMKIVVMVVGTRGDVQPFIYMGLSLEAKGHDVRIATHVDYRNLVQREGLKYFPLAGDPRKLSEYMVKTGGRLLPDLLNEEERTAIPEKLGMMFEIIQSTWPACTAPDPDDPLQEPFIADAIISNPVTNGHIHCAEALAVPLHIMFPQPWFPTRTFPHPLSNYGYASRWSTANLLTYKFVDEFMWMGMGSFINSWRQKALKLQPIRTGENGDQLLNDNKVPISHMWSPSFVPPCIDWPPYVDVVGDFVRKDPAPAQAQAKASGKETSGMSYAKAAGAGAGATASREEKSDEYTPDFRLRDFLAKCGQEQRPIYIGFGSMVMTNGDKLVEMVKEASARTGYPVLMQSGWTKYAEDYNMLSETIMALGAMPHSWLFEQVSAVIHHGGAGTTSAGLRAGKPTFICPFFGDQHFWAEMVHRAGVGPPGCPIETLTSEKLVTAFSFLRSPQTVEKVRELAERMNAEDGVSAGIDSFYRNLPLADMLCEVSIFERQSRMARCYCDECGLKLSAEVDAVVHGPGSGREGHQRIPYKCVKWGVAPPSSLLAGVGQGVGVAAYELAGGLYDFVAAPIKGGRKQGALGFGKGIAKGFVNLVARPVKGGGILLDRIKNSLIADNTNDHITAHHHGSKNRSKTRDGRSTSIIADPMATNFYTENGSSQKSVASTASASSPNSSSFTATRRLSSVFPPAPSLLSLRTQFVSATGRMPSLSDIFTMNRRAMDENFSSEKVDTRLSSSSKHIDRKKNTSCATTSGIAITSGSSKSNNATGKDSSVQQQQASPLKPTASGKLSEISGNGSSNGNSNSSASNAALSIQAPVSSTPSAVAAAGSQSPSSRTNSPKSSGKGGSWSKKSPFKCSRKSMRTIFNFSSKDLLEDERLEAEKTTTGKENGFFAESSKGNSRDSGDFGGLVGIAAIGESEKSLNGTTASDTSESQIAANSKKIDALGLAQTEVTTAAVEETEAGKEKEVHIEAHTDARARRDSEQLSQQEDEEQQQQQEQERQQQQQQQLQDDIARDVTHDLKLAAEGAAVAAAIEAGAHISPAVRAEYGGKVNVESVNKALQLAYDFRDLFDLMDTKAERAITIGQLKKSLPEAEAAMLSKVEDLNDEAALTFAEVAAKIVFFTKVKLRNVTSNQPLASSGK